MKKINKLNMFYIKRKSVKLKNKKKKMIIIFKFF